MSASLLASCQVDGAFHGRPFVVHWCSDSCGIDGEHNNYLEHVSRRSTGVHARARPRRLLSSGLYRRLRIFTESTGYSRFAGLACCLTAGREFPRIRGHPAPKAR